MSTLSRVWPSGDAYQNAVLSPKRFLKDTRLHTTQVESKFFLGGHRPHLRSGNFGAVYKLRNRQRAFALKVFYKADPDRLKRYQVIGEHLSKFAKSAHLVSFQYEDAGILVNGRWYPTLVMDWVHGQPLDLYLHEQRERFDNGGLCLGWLNLMEGLANRKVAHGDLQHGNILVLPNGHFQLVDYDGMFAPPMRDMGLKAAESGLSAYQHPGRESNRDHFNERLDDFSALVILLTLACLTKERWEEYHTDDNCLLFRKSDFTAPQQSRLFAELMQSNDAPIRRLATLLKAAAMGPLESVPAFDQVVKEAALKPLWTAQWRPSPRGKALTFPAADAIPSVGSEVLPRMPAWVEQALKHKSPGERIRPQIPIPRTAASSLPAAPPRARVRELPALAIHPAIVDQPLVRLKSSYWSTAAYLALVMVPATIVAMQTYRDFAGHSVEPTTAREKSAKRGIASAPSHTIEPARIDPSLGTDQRQ